MALEFAQAMRRFGAAVTIVARNSRILPNEDEDVADIMQQMLEREGVEISTSTSPISVNGQSGDQVVLHAKKNGYEVDIKGSHIFCATGRAPNTEDIGLDNAGIELSAQGHIVVDESCRVTEDGTVFAVGDCAGSACFTHAGHDDFRIVRDYILGKSQATSKRRSTRQLPFTLFTDPEFAHVGLRENQAKALGISYKLAKLPMAAFNRAVTLGETDGFAKALISDDGHILGFSAVGVGAGELLPVVQLAMEQGISYQVIADMIISHPTTNEGLGALFGGFATISGNGLGVLLK